MKTRSWVLALGVAGLLAIAVPASGAPSGASCVGQALSVFGPTFGSDLGAQIAFEARNPDTIGGGNFGEVVSSVARADRQACPGE